MPLIPKSRPTPGMDKLPPLVQQLLERAFPPDTLPMPAGSLIYRGPGDIMKLLGNKTQIPTAPQTGQAVSQAFTDYLQKIAQLLQQTPKAGK